MVKTTLLDRIKIYPEYIILISVVCLLLPAEQSGLTPQP